MESKSDRTSQMASMAAGEACYPANQRYTTGSQSCIDVQRKEVFWLKQLHIPHKHQLYIHINTPREGKCVCVHIIDQSRHFYWWYSHTTLNHGGFKVPFMTLIDIRTPYVQRALQSGLHPLKICLYKYSSSVTFPHYNSEVCL